MNCLHLTTKMDKQWIIGSVGGLVTCGNVCFTDFSLPGVKKNLYLLFFLLSKIYFTLFDTHKFEMFNFLVH